MPSAFTWSDSGQSLYLPFPVEVLALFSMFWLSAWFFFAFLDFFPFLFYALFVGFVFVASRCFFLEGHLYPMLRTSHRSSDLDGRMVLILFPVEWSYQFTIWAWRFGLATSRPMPLVLYGWQSVQVLPNLSCKPFPKFGQFPRRIL